MDPQSLPATHPAVLAWFGLYSTLIPVGPAYTVRKEIKCSEKPRCASRIIVHDILRGLVHDFPNFAQYQELIRVLSQFPTTFNFYSNSVMAVFLKGFQFPSTHNTRRLSFESLSSQPWCLVLIVFWMSHQYSLFWCRHFDSLSPNKLAVTWLQFSFWVTQWPFCRYLAQIGPFYSLSSCFRWPILLVVQMAQPTLLPSLCRHFDS